MNFSYRAHFFIKMTVAIFTLCIHTNFAQADWGGSLKVRCKEDCLDFLQAKRRTVWAHKCRHIDLGYTKLLNQIGFYPTYADTIAPVDYSAPCIPSIAYLGTCSVKYCHPEL